MSILLADVRHAVRFFRASPGYSLLAIGTLALAIAANTTVFGWVDSVLLKPIPGVAGAHELAVLEALPPDGTYSNVTHPDFRDFQRELTLASGVTATHTSFFTVGPEDDARRVIGQVVSANFFEVLGVRPFLGRLLRADEDQDAPGAFPVAVISHRLWTRYFRSDAGVVDRVVRINGRQLTIVGVAPPDFHGTIGGASLDVWVPLTQVNQMGALNSWAAADRNARFLDVIVRLKPGITVKQASEEAQAVAARIAAAHPDTHRGIGARLQPMWRASYGLQHTLGDPLRILMAVCVLVLGIACANVANLLTVRSVARQKEFALRMALGAGRVGIVRLVVVEVLLLAMAGAVSGVLLAQWFAEAMVHAVPFVSAPVREAIEPLLRPELSASVLAFCILVALAAAAVSVVLPAISAGRLDLNSGLKEGVRGASAGGGSHRVRQMLVSAEVALATVALVGAGLAVRSFQRYSEVDPGFRSDRMLIAHLHLSTNGYALKDERQFNRDLLLRLQSAPEVAKAAYTDSIPLGMLGPPTDRVQVEGSLPDREGVPSVLRSIVSPGYLEAMGIPILAGRDFTEQDDERAPRVIVVNQTFARRFFGGQEPMGRKVRVSGGEATIIGLVKDSKYRMQSESAAPFFYCPFRQYFYSGHNNFFLVRAAGDLNSARAAFHREAAALGAGIGLYEFATLEEATQMGLFGQRVAASLLSVLGALSLLLATVGLYGVMAYAVSERTHEIGVRMALGARPVQVLGMVMRQGLTMTGGGIAAGVAISMATVRILEGTLSLPMLGSDAEVFVGATLCLSAVALLACYIPARRATKVDPMIALRTE